MGTYAVYYGNSYHPHLFFDYTKEEVIKQAKAEGTRRKVHEITINRSTGNVYGGVHIGTWERRGTRWYKQ